MTLKKIVNKETDVLSKKKKEKAEITDFKKNFMKMEIKAVSSHLSFTNSKEKFTVIIIRISDKLHMECQHSRIT